MDEVKFINPITKKIDNGFMVDFYRGCFCTVKSDREYFIFKGDLIK